MEFDHQEKREDGGEDDVAVYETTTYFLDKQEATAAAMRLTATSATSATTTSVDASGEGNNKQVSDSAKRSQEMTETDAAAPKSQAKKQKVVSTKDIVFPSLPTFVDLWEEGPLGKGLLQSENSLFGAKRSWFIRKSYITLLRDILQDTIHKIQIVHGTAGIGKSAFLLYVLAWIRSGGDKSVLLYFHRIAEETAAAVFFPAGGQPVRIYSDNSQYRETFDNWYEQINEQAGYFLVDGMATFNGVPEHTNVNYIVAKSPSCEIGWFKKSPNKKDRWLTIWAEPELLLYASQAEIAEDVVKENMRYLGGIVRYAFLPGAAEYAANDAIYDAGPEELFKLVDTGLQSKFDNLKIVDRLIHRLPPESGIGNSAKFKFASEYVATKISMALAISMKVETQSLLRIFKSVGPAGSMRGMLFEAYAARQMATGGNFPIKPLSSCNTKDILKEGMLDLSETTILQKDTKTLNKMTYPPTELLGRLVWPNPDYNLPAIDMFMLLGKTIIAFQMTVSTSHTLEIGGCKAFLRYFDSVSRELQKINPNATVYKLFFVVPADIYDRFTKTAQPITGKNGVVLISQEAKDISARISQWVMKVE